VRLHHVREFQVTVGRLVFHCQCMGKKFR